MEQGKKGRREEGKKGRREEGKKDKGHHSQQPARRSSQSVQLESSHRLPSSDLIGNWKFDLAQTLLLLCLQCLLIALRPYSCLGTGHLLGTRM